MNTIERQLTTEETLKTLQNWVTGTNKNWTLENGKFYLRVTGEKSVIKSLSVATAKKLINR